MMTFVLAFITALTVNCALAWVFFSKPYKKFVQSHTELKHAKREAEKIAQLPINNPHPLIQISLEGEIIFANPAAYKHYPTLAETCFAHPTLTGLGDFIACAKKNKKERKMITREVSFADIVYHQTVTSVRVNGRMALVIYCYDITDIKTAQNEARLLGTVMGNATDGVIITKADLDNPEIVYVNDAVTRISGYDEEELIGQTPRILQGTGTSRDVLDELKTSLMKGKSFKGELQNYTKDGIAYWLDISIVPVKDDKGNITHFAAIERDITGRKALEKEMQINREAAEVANRAKDDFLANMSHELRTPMNGIIGLSELLMEMDLPDDQNELTDAINSSSRNLLILLNDILDLSKIEAGELTLEHIPFETRRTVRQTIDLLRPMASRKGIVLDSSISPIVPERIMGDPARLQQIMNNLISNAIKFTEVGYVRIDISSTRDHVGDPVLNIRFEDTGIGIPEEKCDSIFQKFTQADVSTARKYGGTGLGLSITKELVEIMGGIIGVDSVEGKGTTFHVEIPIEVASADHIIEDIVTGTKGASINTNAKILVVDDHPVNLLFMRKVLKKIGFDNADEAATGMEAIALAEETEYDLILMDCQMPEIDGFEASTIIREREENIGDIKIVAVTADAMKGARERCIDSGMNDYISKPVDVEKLRAVLGEWIPGNGTATESTATDIIEHPPQNTDTNIMDWDRLDMFTDGDPDEERALIEMFTTYATESLDDLRMYCKKNDNEEWKKAAHKLKGSAANLGAQSLSDICFKAEESFESSAEEKEEIFKEITIAYEQICKALEAHSNTLQNA